MSYVMCACGNPDGYNPECERCRLIAEVSKLKERIAKLEQILSVWFITPEELERRIDMEKLK